jgi:hypothetical protein
MKLRTMVALTCMLTPALAECQAVWWWPAWSEVTGTRYRNNIADRWPATILYVGGDLLLVSPYRVQPGAKRIVVQAPRHDGHPGTVLELEVKLEPCVRYYINAQFDGPVGPNWRPVVDSTEVIPGCPLPGT